MQTISMLYLLAASFSGALSAEQVEITLYPGAGGDFRSDSRVPILVVLKNTYKDLDGRVEVILKDVAGDATAAATRSVPLPLHSRKAVFLYVMLSEMTPSGIEVRYVSETGKRVASVDDKIRCFSSHVPVVCGIENLPPQLPADVDKSENQRYERLFMKPDQIPPDAAGLEMLDTIILYETPPRPLDNAQGAALRDWVLRGGTLVVDASSRSDAFHRGGLPDLLPFIPTGVRDADLERLEAHADFTEGTVVAGKVLLESNGYPLVVRRQMGLGSVTCFAISMSSPALTTWNGRELLWAGILSDLRLGERLTAADFQRVSGEDSRKEQLMGLVQERQRPGLRLGMVLLLTALYALAVGPGDYYLLKWLGKPKLTWITFPAIVAVFTVGAYLGARAWIGGEMASASTQRILICQNEGVALQYDLASLFVPGAREYELKSKDGGAPYRIDSGGLLEGTFAIDHDTDTITTHIPIWQRRVFGIDKTVAEYPNVLLELSRTEDGARRVKVINHSEVSLNNCVLISKEGVTRLDGGIRAGQEAEAVLQEGGRGARGGEGHAMWLNIGSGTRDAWAHGRQFDARDAIEHGAVIFHAQQAGAAPCPLIVNGAPRPESGPRVLEVIAYEGSTR